MTMVKMPTQAPSSHRLDSSPQAAATSPCQLLCLAASSQSNRAPAISTMRV